MICRIIYKDKKGDLHTVTVNSADLEIEKARLSGLGYEVVEENCDGEND